MPLESKKTSLLLLLVITAFVCSRALFFFFHDPEGPNLLIVTVLALILYSASFIAWKFTPQRAQARNYSSRSARKYSSSPASIPLLEAWVEQSEPKWFKRAV
jgi:hypothetical protein